MHVAHHSTKPEQAVRDDWQLEM